MMKIQVLGSGCPTCKKLYEMVKLAVSEIDENIEVEYLVGAEGIEKIIELGAMSSPVLAVNDKVITNFGNSVESIKEKIINV